MGSGVQSSGELVSIVIPCFNNGRFVAPAVRSVQAQTFENWQLVLIDDCSSDDTFPLLQELAARDPRIEAHKLAENGGPGVARNAGIEKARGRYIAFLDADDLWLPNKLEKQLARLAETGAAICHTSTRFIDENGASIPGGVNVSALADIGQYMKTTEIGTSTAVIDTAQTGPFAFDEMRNRQDAVLWMQLLGRGLMAAGVREPLVQYRIRPGQVSANKVKMVWITFKVYMKCPYISLPKRAWYFMWYCINAVRKRGQVAE